MNNNLTLRQASLKKIGKRVASAMAVAILMMSLAGCTLSATGVKAADLMKGIDSRQVEDKHPDDIFVDSQMQLSWELFYESAMKKVEENTLISPLSISLALAMTANGANGDTRTEMENLLAKGYTLEELNQYLGTYIKNLPSEEDYKLAVANSIWFRDDASRLTVDKDFLQINADYYNAQAYKSAFDETTVKDMNARVKEHTDGMIEEIIKEISSDNMMYLMNAVTFDAKWATKYTNMDVYTGSFTTLDKTAQEAEYLCSMESSYLEDEWATGFVKPYAGEKYSFVALLPKDESAEGFTRYLEILKDGEAFAELMNNQKKESVSVQMPKFSYEYEITLNSVLKEMGMEKAFDGGAADFSKLGSSPDGNLYIGKVLHKTFIEVSETGTKAGAVTRVDVEIECEPMYEHEVYLKRPFVYVIMDNETNLPIFIGTVTEVQ